MDKPYSERLYGSMKKTFSVTVLTVFTGLLLSGCSSAASTPTNTPDPGATASKSAISTPKLETQQQTNLLAKFKTIDPTLDTPRSVEIARQQCRMILRNDPEPAQITFVKKSFRNAGLVSIASSDEKAKRVIDAIKDNGFCEASK